MTTTHIDHDARRVSKTGRLRLKLRPGQLEERLDRLVAHPERRNIWMRDTFIKARVNG